MWSKLASFLNRIEDKTISGKIAKDVFEAMWAGEGSVDEIIEKKGLKQITDTGAIEKIIDEVLANNTTQVEQYKGRQVMKASKGKANPGQVNEMLKKKLAAI